MSVLKTVRHQRRQREREKRREEKRRGEKRREEKRREEKRREDREGTRSFHSESPVNFINMLRVKRVIRKERTKTASEISSPGLYLWRILTALNSMSTGVGWGYQYRKEKQLQAAMLSFKTTFKRRFGS